MVCTIQNISINFCKFIGNIKQVKQYKTDNNISFPLHNVKTCKNRHYKSTKFSTATHKTGIQIVFFYINWSIGRMR